MLNLKKMSWNYNVVQSPTDDKKDAHGFGKEICLIARNLNPARKSRGARLECYDVSQYERL